MEGEPKDIVDNIMSSRLATNANTVETILHGSVGFLTARSGGHLVSLHCYVSPYDIFEEGTGTQLNLTDNNGECSEVCLLHLYTGVLCCLSCALVWFFCPV